MKNPLKPVFDVLSISGGEACLLFLFTSAGSFCAVWGLMEFPREEWLWPELSRNIPFVLGVGTLAVTFLIFLGCMRNTERRGMILALALSLAFHLALLLSFTDLIVGYKPTDEHEVTLNLNPKAPIIVNDYYYGELPGDELLDGESAEDSTLPRPQTPQNSVPDAGPVNLEEEMKLVAQTHSEVEAEAASETDGETNETNGEMNGTESETNGQKNAPENPSTTRNAQTMAQNIEISESERPERTLKEDENRPQPETFVNRETSDEKVTASGLAMDAPTPQDLTVEAQMETETAVAASRKKINLEEEAKKRRSERSGFTKKLEENREKSAVGEPHMKSDASREGENVVSGAAQNWGEVAAETPAGGAGETMGEIRSGSGETAGPAASAYSVKTEKKESKKTKKPKKLTVSDAAPTEVAGGQTTGARAGSGSELDSYLAGAANGISDAVLQMTAQPEKFTGSNLANLERRKMLDNVVIFRFEDTSIPELGMHFDPEAPRILTDSDSDSDLQEEDGENDEMTPRPNLAASTPNLLEPEGALEAEPALPYRQRMRSNHRKMIEEAGGNPISEEIVEQGLQFLERGQFPDGRWSFNAVPYELPQGMRPGDFGFGTIHSDTAATGLALLSYLGAGYTHMKSEEETPKDYSATVQKGLSWLLNNQQTDGSLFTESSDSNRYARIYAQGIAAIALCEAYGMTRDARLREPAQRAIDFVVKAQTPQGGWRYTPEKTGETWRNESDTSVSGWQAMALVSAKMAGLNVPEATFTNLDRWVRHAAIDGGARFCYIPIENPTNDEMKSWRKPSCAMTAEGLLMELYLNYDPKKPKFQEAVNYLSENLPSVTDGKRRNTYYWYYATQVMYHIHDARWMEWQKQLVTALQQSQEKKNPVLRGSWNPYKPAPDYWGQACGRHYTTAMHLLMLEVYYRHLPIFRELAPNETEVHEN